ncbi:MAG: HDOD domain-containing protein [Myxococcota bacterium]|nr:HDOD domain-containing protein [Myxococcota bacterium]
MRGWLAKRKDRSAKEALREAIGDFDLPQFPSVILEAMRLIRDDAAPVEDIADALRADPGLSVRVLGLVNSPGFGLRHPVDDLPHAVQLIGRSSLESLLITLGTRQAVPSAGQTHSQQALFWRTAARRAAVSARLASHLCPSERARLFTAALLQDMALPLLEERHESEYEAIHEALATDPERTLTELERERFGWDHAEVGEIMCEVWGLPPGLGEAVGAHHLPLDEVAIELAPVSLSALLGDDEEGGADPLLEAAKGLGSLEVEKVEELILEGLRDAEDVTRLLG